MACIPAITCFNDQKAFAEMIFSEGYTYSNYFNEIGADKTAASFDDVLFKAEMKYSKLWTENISFTTVRDFLWK